MDKIKAKSVVPNKFWILQRNDDKVGEVIRVPSGFKVTINGKEAGDFKSLESLKKSPMFTFIDYPAQKIELTDSVEGYPSDGAAHNAVWDVKYSLPLYTQSEDSKSWFAAGYYQIDVHGTQVIQFCPKFIALQRNEFTGPFKTDPSLVQFNKMFDE